MQNILLVDDDVEIVELLSTLLTLEGFNVDIAHNGLEALEKLSASHSIVLLDVTMPELNGFETLKRIRLNYSVPVLMLTARGDDSDRIQGLELGADDYLPKPFNDRELLARIKAILRRTNRDETVQEEHILEFEGIKLDSQLQQARFNGVDLELTGSEFLLLHYLIHHIGTPISRDDLSINALGKKPVAFDRTIDMHMSNLRRKLPSRQKDLPWFKTVRGHGYILLSHLDISAN